jgi:hypothetical protein
MTEIIQEQIDNVLNDIDFTKIRKAMEATDWQWTHLERTPNEVELEEVAKKILTQLAYGEKDNISMGGFEAVKRLGVLELKFVLDRSSPLGIFIKNNG